MLEIPNLNTVYSDDTINLMVHDIDGEGTLLVVHAEVIPVADRNLLDHYAMVVDSLFEALKAKGVTEVEAWVNDDDEIKYAQFFGFNEFLGELTVNQQTCLPHVFRLRRKLT